MKRIFAMAFLAWNSFTYAQQNFNCGTGHRLTQLYSKYPELEREHEEFIRHCFANPSTRSGETVYIIPVVFHIIHEYGNENISDAQVLDQVNILNRDFRKLNADTADVVPAFDSIIADPHIEFRLATKDPNGNCTNGINHYYSHETRVGDDFSKLHLWPRNKYLNIWVVKSMENGVAGYAYYPSATVGFLAFADGIIILNSYIGSIGTSSPSRSRALTHEIGHYLNLAHLWGNTNSPGVACGNDGIPDTPETRGWDNCNLTDNDVCNPGIIENVQNYMEYSYCSRMFTEDQSIVMQQTLNENIAFRNNLWKAENLSETGTDVLTTPLCSPVADAYPSEKYICAGDNVTFRSASWRAPVDSYLWTFDGGVPVTSTLANPTVTFNDVGWHNVTLTVTNAAGSDTKTFVHAIFVSNPLVEYIGPTAESFESTSTSDWWISDNQSNNETYWQRVAIPSAATGSYCYMLNNHKDIDLFSYNYFNKLGGNIDALISPSYDLSLTTSATLTFKYSCATHASIASELTEELKVFATNNCGKTWVLRLTLDGTDLANAGVAGSNYVPVNNSSIFWRTASITIPPFLLAPNVKFKFEYIASDHSNNIYIDDINVNGIVGIEDQIQIPFSFDVYPNPVNAGQSITVEYTNETGNMTMAIYDVVGNLIYTNAIINQNGYVKLDIPIGQMGLSKGMYTVTLFNQEFRQSKPIVIN